jgi:hypothetical protein
MTTESSALSVAWTRAAAALPPDWELKGLQCASTGLSPEERSEEWIAVAIGPDGREVRHRAEEPTSALEGLVASVVESL